MLRKKKTENTEEIVPQAVYFTSDEKIENEDFSDDSSSKKKKPLMEILGLIEKIENSQNAMSNLIEKEETIETKEKVVESINLNSNEAKDIQIDANVHNTEDETEKLYQEKLDINEIYSKFGPSTKDTNTIYIIDSFLKALPDNLPSDIKLQSVLGIIDASKMDIEQLLNDGDKRLEVLSQFFKNFMDRNDKVINENEREISILTEKINHHNKIIEGRKKLQEEQKSVVKFEVQKIENIINFVQNKKQ
ncbi:MAG: hypothetical protein K0R09_537 [Clostridiales bacterium]|nr:hypothetical protein [Clostridiales bacterium]